jgi:hypothetical protein
MMVATGLLLLGNEFDKVAAPQIPVLFIVVNLLIASLVIFSVDHVDEGLAYPHIRWILC